MAVAREIWPDSILTEPPVHLKVANQSIAAPREEEIEVSRLFILFLAYMRDDVPVSMKTALQQSQAAALVPTTTREELVKSLKRLQAIIVQFVEAKKNRSASTH
jgi:hypothetical protein